MIALMSEDIAALYETALAPPSISVRTEPQADYSALSHRSSSGKEDDSLVVLLKVERPRKIGTLDPSRQPSQLPQVGSIESQAVMGGTSGSSKSTNLTRTINRTTSAPITNLPVDNFLSTTKSSAANSSRVISSKLSRTTSAPLPRDIDQNDVQPIKTTGGVSKKRRPRVSSHIPPPPAIDQRLESCLNINAGAILMDIDEEGEESLFEPPFIPIVIPADSYEIIFILDSREVKSTRNRDHIENALRKLGVSVEKRALEVGDMCWIARQKSTQSDFVLDYIIERKRIDDLVGSIKDGRFHEQKVCSLFQPSECECLLNAFTQFRLKQSGLSRLYYLVEEYTENYVHKSMDKSVFTALSSTQVVDGFFLKETRDIEDTIEYVAGLHHTIVAQYHVSILYLIILIMIASQPTLQNKALHVIPDDAIHRHSHMALITQLRNAYPDIPYHTSYASFRALNKSGSVTLKDVFARMLLCIRGMSAEKVATILEHYDTPRRLWDAFRDAEVVEVQERAAEAEQVAEGNGKKGKKKSQVIPAKHMLTRLLANGRREIKCALSEQVYDLFMSEEY